MGSQFKTVVIVCAKKESKRFPKKNRQLIRGVVDQILMLSGIDKVVISTDDKEILRMYPRSTRVKKLEREYNSLEPEDSLFNIALWSYYSLNEPYDIVIIANPNVVNFKKRAVYEAIQVLIKKNRNEVRTYDINGVENGLIVMKRDYFLKRAYSSYVGAIITDAKEIHYEAELDEHN